VKEEAEELAVAVLFSDAPAEPLAVAEFDTPRALAAPRVVTFDVNVDPRVDWMLAALPIPATVTLLEAEDPLVWFVDSVVTSLATVLPVLAAPVRVAPDASRELDVLVLLIVPASAACVKLPLITPFLASLKALELV